MQTRRYRRNPNAEALFSHSQIGQGMLQRRKNHDEEQRRRANNRHAKMMRDQAIMDIHRLSYSRNGKLIPRRKELRGKLDEAVQRARVYASLARPEQGYPAPPFVRDPDYPSDATMGRPRHGLSVNHRVAERNRLTFWLSVLEDRGAPVEVRERIEMHIELLSKRISRELTNDGVRRVGSRKEYNLLPAPSGVVIIVEKR